MQINNVVIYEENDLTPLTVNSIKANMPDWTYKVVPVEDSKIGLALKNINDTSLVVKSGVVLKVKEGDLPSKERLKNYHMALSRFYVFHDHFRLHASYETKLGKPINPNIVDMSVFIINPNMWSDVPKKDVGIFADKKKLYMPRYMNHRNDMLMEECLSARDCNTYGILAEDACALNYVGIILKGYINMSERFSYPFDEINKYTEGLNEKYKQTINKFATMTQGRYDKFRKALHKIKKD